jgi:hypothetical protein
VVRQTPAGLGLQIESGIELTFEDIFAGIAFS